jgi:hypothetical protein
MPPLDQFLIAPITKGLQNDVAPWLIPDEAYSQLENAYVWRGMLRKRFGSSLLEPDAGASVGFEQLHSRLRIKIGATDGISGTISGFVPGAIFKVGQMFSIGTELYTVVTAGIADMITNAAVPQTRIFNTGTGSYNLKSNLLAVDVYFYPAEPVMGILQYEEAAINDEPTIAFDTQFSYQYLATGWDRLGTQVWTGSDSQFFWGVNYRGADTFDRLFFVTNSSSTDGINYWDGSTWTALVAQYSASANDVVLGCKLILSFGNRLLLLNTTEKKDGSPPTTNNIPNRVRYSQFGAPINPPTNDTFYAYPAASGKGGYEDIPTKEAIISARILRDRAIIFCERSTWELVKTGNEVRPFRFQRINSELGVESTFSSILFDKVLLGVGNVGIHACNGANVERIDEKIPDEVFDFHNENQGVDRVYGVRDYYSEMAYWTVPDKDNNPTYPNKIIAYNYRNRTWAKFDDSITCFGTLQTRFDETWGNTNDLWGERHDTWGGAKQQSEFPQVIGGNQQGWTFTIDRDNSRNSPALQITQLANAAGVVTVTCVDHNLQTSDYVLIENVEGVTGVDGPYEITSIPSDDTFTIFEPSFAGTYTSSGTVARISRIDVRTKDFNFYQKQGRNLFIPKMSFFVDRTESGEIRVDIYPSSASNTPLYGEAVTTGCELGTGILETTPYSTVPFEDNQTRFWHAIYTQAEGESLQVRLYLDDEQMLDKNIALSDFRLNAISIYSRQVHRF